MPYATPAMGDVIASSVGFSAVGRKKVTAAFDGGRLTSVGGVLLVPRPDAGQGVNPPVRSERGDTGMAGHFQQDAAVG